MIDSPKWQFVKCVQVCDGEWAECREAAAGGSAAEYQWWGCEDSTAGPCDTAGAGLQGQCQARRVPAAPGQRKQNNRRN